MAQEWEQAAVRDHSAFALAHSRCWTRINQEN